MSIVVVSIAKACFFTLSHKSYLSDWTGLSKLTIGIAEGVVYTRFGRASWCSFRAFIACASIDRLELLGVEEWFPTAKATNDFSIELCLLDGISCRNHATIFLVPVLTVFVLFFKFYDWPNFLFIDDVTSLIKPSTEFNFTSLLSAPFSCKHWLVITSAYFSFNTEIYKWNVWPIWN